MQLRFAAFLATALVGIAVANPANANPTEKIDLPGGSINFVRLAKGKITSGDDMPRDAAISADIYFAEIPVTRGQFAAFVAESKYATESEKGTSGGFGWNGTKLEQKAGVSWKNPGFQQSDPHPVVLITAKDAGAYITWASMKTGRPFRLPTEAEYAYAARAGAPGPLSAKDSLRYGFYKDQTPSAGTHPVREKAANAWGLYDLGGNAFAWTSDVAPDGRQILRGGSWMRDAKAKSATRLESSSGTRNAEIGFRLVVDSMGNTLAGSSPKTNGSKPNADTASGSAGLMDNPTKEGESGASSVGAVLVLVLAAFMGVGLFVVVVVLIARIFGTKKRTNPHATVEMVKRDGFFIRANFIRSHTRLRWRCLAGGKRIAGDLFPEPNVATFVYTGAPPSAIEVKFGDDVESRSLTDDAVYQSAPNWHQHGSAQSVFAGSNPSYGDSNDYSGSSSTSAAGGGGDFGGGGASASYDDAPLGNPRAY